MPTLNTDNQISDLALNNLSKALVPTFDSFTLLQKQLTICFPILEMQKSLQKMLADSVAISMNSIFKSIFEEQSKMFDMLKASLAQAFFIYPLQNYYPTREIDVVEVNENPVTLSITIEGRFFFSGRPINTITTNSKHGKLLKLLLSNEYNYVTDAQIEENIGVMDKDKGIGYLRRDLKKALKEAGIEINLYREEKIGYRLLGISRLLN